MKTIHNIVSKVRLPVWWYHLVPPILSVAYVAIWMGKVAIDTIVLPLALFSGSVMGTAAFGYWLNDWTDLELDTNSGKTNHTDGLNILQKWSVLLLLLILGWTPWFFLPANNSARIALLLLHICFFLYSVPPFRFKERGFLGVICDIHYGHVLPIVIALTTFIPLWLPNTILNWHLIILPVIILYIKGFRNIIEHQINDRKKDYKNGVHTFVIAIGALKAVKLLSLLLIPLELTVIGLFLILWAWQLFIFYTFFLIVYVFLLQCWGVFRLPYRHRWFKIWYIANDYYESWLPLSILIMISLEDICYILILSLHLLLFSKNLQFFKWVLIEIKSFLTRYQIKTQTTN